MSYIKSKGLTNMLCPNCEAENRDDAKFCDECGFPLGGAIARAAAASSPRVSAPVPDEPSFDVFADEPQVLQAPDAKPASEQESFDDELFSFDDVDPLAGVPAEETFDPGVTSPISSAAPKATAETAPTVVFPEKDWPENATEAIEGDSFAGFSTPAEETEFAFFDEDPMKDFYAESNPASPSSTMQMPRVAGEAGPASRDFRVSPSASRRPPKAALIVVGLVAVAVTVAVVTFVLGLWGGVAVPDVTGMTENDARAVLEESGFSVRSTQVKSDDTEGLVLVMDPVAGSRAAEGSEVIIHIATARFVPDIVGKSYDEAKALLEEAGYENVKYEKVKSTGPENIVLSVSPEAGTRAKSSMEVIVGVSEAYRVPDISGMDLSAAQEAITKGGLVPQVVYVDTQEQPEGTILGTTPAANTKVSEGDYVSINVARARGAELVSLTEQMFSPGSTATIGGTSIAVDSVDSVSYLGDDTVSFKITGRPFATLMGETVYGSATTVEGQVVWSDDNEVVSIS